MPKRARELSALEVRRITRPGMHTVGGVAGLMVQVQDSGAKSWVLRISVGGKRRHLGLGPFPEVTLAHARDEARRIKAQVRQGVDPIAERRAAQNALRAAHTRALTFAQAARRCHGAKAGEFRNAKHAKEWLASLENHAFPVIGSRPVADIELPEVLAVLEPIWRDKTETATRLRQRIEAILSWAAVSGYRSGENPARWAGNLKEVLPSPAKIAKVRHHRAVPWHEIPEFMVALREREGMAARALEFLILTAARSGEVRGAQWSEFDLRGRVWTVPGERIKAGKQHRVPLSADALAIVEGLPRMEGNDYVFPGTRGALSDMTLGAVLKRMGVDAVPHGFRSSFKDWARNCTAYADEVSELALAHVNSDATRAAYARDELLQQRRRLMADWATFARSGNETAMEPGSAE